MICLLYPWVLHSKVFDHNIYLPQVYIEIVIRSNLEIIYSVWEECTRSMQILCHFYKGPEHCRSVGDPRVKSPVDTRSQLYTQCAPLL
jgi:hypothetical protein